MKKKDYTDEKVFLKIRVYYKKEFCRNNTMETMLKTKSEKICTILLLMIFLFSLLYNFYLIYTKLNPYFVESDLVNEITYRQQCYRQKSLFAYESN